MNLLVINIILALIWAALTGIFEPSNLVLGFGLGYLILLAIRKALGPTRYFDKMSQVVIFTAFFLWELVIANLRVAWHVLTPPSRFRPQVIAVPLETCNEAETTLLANLISLTPGTLSLDVSTDECVLYIHVIDAPDAETARKEIKEGFERKVLDLVRGAGKEE
jgi:multicomponent Na+:H+ antiporter subunit E